MQPGMICVSRKKKTAVFRQYTAAETAVPVIACAACLEKDMEKVRLCGSARVSLATFSPDHHGILLSTELLLRRHCAIKVGEDTRRWDGAKRGRVLHGLDW